MYTISYVAPSQSAVPLVKVGPTVVTVVVKPHDAATTGVPSTISSAHSTTASAGPVSYTHLTLPTICSV